MDSPTGQEPPSRPRERGPSPTRERLLLAAAELIADVGWGRVTTRSVAERAGVPHGAVSYHFAGKQELLTEAALHAFGQAFPAEELQSLGSLDDVLVLMEQWMSASLDDASLVSRLGVELLSESARDAALRERVGAMLEAYREVLVQLVEADVRAGANYGDASPRALATLVPAAADGLFLHAAMGAQQDAVAAMAALRSLLRR